MAGTSSITGDQSIFSVDNLSFDGTRRGGAMSADGQLWIGATASDRANNGGHVRLGNITGSGGIVVTNGAGTINIAGTGPTTDLHVARFIVASSTVGTGANYTSIAAALAAAQGTGIASTIFLQPGIYTENVTLTPGINLCAFECDSTTPNVTIVGTITMTATGWCSVSGIRLQTNGAPIVTVSGANTPTINLLGCNFIIYNGATGLTNTATAGSIFCQNCNGDVSDATSKLFAQSTSSNWILFDNCYITNSKNTQVVNTTASTISTGNLFVYNSNIAVPMTSSGTAAINVYQSTIDLTTFFTPGSANVTCLTVGGSGTNAVSNCYFDSGTASAISVGGTLTLANSTIKSSNTNAITGAGTLNFGNLNFSGTSSLINTTTQVPLVASNNAIKVVTPGAYPYTTTAQDGLIKVDTSSARTIIPLASPTTGQKHIIKDTVGSAAANNITITPSGKNIDGAASSTMNIAYGSATIVYNGTEWSII